MKSRLTKCQYRLTGEARRYARAWILRIRPSTSVGLGLAGPLILILSHTENAAGPMETLLIAVCACRYFVPLAQAALSKDWGCCLNRKSPRAGLLTFEHQGCREFEYGPAVSE
jgi:hypothetical protein